MSLCAIDAERDEAAVDLAEDGLENTDGADLVEDREAFAAEPMDIDGEKMSKTPKPVSARVVSPAAIHRAF